MQWQPIETVPETGVFLTYEDGAIRTSWRYNGAWDLLDIPVFVTAQGDRLVPREVAQYYKGCTLEMSGCMAREPTHWMPLPEPPK